MVKHFLAFLIISTIVFTCTPVSIKNYSNIKQANAGVAKEKAPLPEKITYKKPAGDVPAKIQNLLGKWEGDWGGELNSYFIFENVTPNSAELIGGWGTSALFVINQSGHMRDTALLETNSDDSTVKFMFTFQPIEGTVSYDGETINAVWAGRSKIKMNKTGTPDFELPEMVAKKPKITKGAAQADRIIDAKYYLPSGELKNVAIMFLGGSGGGFPKYYYYNIKSFTDKGYPCMLLGYFQTENTPDHLEMIPLEYFEDAIKAFKSHPEVKDKKIVVCGTSKGGELALLLASRYKQIEGVIAKVPSSVVFQGIGGSSSSWSYKGKPIPFVPYAPYDYRKKVNSQYCELYELSLKQTQAVEKATIQVENISGSILILTGKKDTMWPSSQMGEMIIKRLEEKKFPHWYRHFAYEDAGHSLNDSNLMGGTMDGNKKARIDSERRIINFLNRLSGE